MSEEKGPASEKRGSPSETERLSTPADAYQREIGAVRWANIVREVGARGDPQDGPRSFGYGEAVERVLALEREVAALRGRLEERYSLRSPLASGSDELSSDSPHSADATPSESFTRPAEPAAYSAEWDPRRRAECPECGRAIPADSLARHRRRAHTAAPRGAEVTP